MPFFAQPGHAQAAAAGAPRKPSVGLRGGSPAPTTTITLGQSIAPLNGPWKFHIGDNPADVDDAYQVFSDG